MNDGGPAFPSKSQGFVDMGAHGEAVVRYAETPGMSLRDWFAGQALQNLFRYNKSRQLISEPEDVALRAYMFADAMLAQRNEKLEV
jgi:hypothetical protein